MKNTVTQPAHEAEALTGRWSRRGDGDASSRQASVPRLRGNESQRIHSYFQVRIYEEDFKRERSDRERLSQEKEALQQASQASQAQLSRLKSKVETNTKSSTFSFHFLV